MRHPETHIVTMADQSSLNKDGRCRYCQQPVGEEHKPTCHIRKHTVVMRFSFEVIYEAPEEWDIDFIEYYLNGNTRWSTDNAIDMINRARARLGDIDDLYTATYLREATQEDEDRWYGPKGCWI